MLKTSIGILSLSIVVIGLFVHPVVIGVHESCSLCPFQPNVDEDILEIMEQHYIPSTTVAVVRSNSIIWAKGYGEQQRLDLIHMVGSVTKTFTATAIFQLYERGVLGLDDDVNDYLPFSLRHPNYTETPITIKMLLQHRSGLSKDTDQYWYGIAAVVLQELGWENPYDWLTYPFWIEGHLTPNGSLYNSSAWTAHEPGTNRFYSNLGYDVLGYIVGLATGQTIWEYLQENIFGPLGMQSTGYNHTDFEASQLAVPYIYMYEMDPDSEGNEAYPHHSILNYGAGGLRSDIFDLARFLLVFLHEGVSNGTRILEKGTLEEMEDLETAWLAPGNPLIQWGGWGGTEGDALAFHAKVHAYYGGNTTVPYGVITLLNQGQDSARDAAFSITELLRVYIHDYDVTALDCTDGWILQAALAVAASAAVAVIALVIIVKRRTV